MIEIFFIILGITVFYIVPLGYCVNRAYEKVDGFFFLVSWLPFFNLAFTLVFGFEDVVKYLKRRKHE